MLGFGLFVFTKEPGEEGWGYIVAIIICLFSLIPLMLDLITKALIRNNKLCLIVQVPIAVMLLLLYWKWELIGM